MLGGLLTSGLGQTLIGAGLGYAADRAMGGKGGIGAIGGGLLGAGNAFTSGAGLLSGTPSQFATSGVGSTLGEYNLLPQDMQQTFNIANTGRVGSFANQATPQGLLNSGLMDYVGPLSNAYGTYSQGQQAKAEIDYRNRMAGLAEDEYNYMKRARQATQEGLDQGFQNVYGKSNYYTI